MHPVLGLLAGTQAAFALFALMPGPVEAFDIYAKYGIAGLALLVSTGLIWLVGKLFDRLSKQEDRSFRIREVEAQNATKLVKTLEDLVTELRQRTVLISHEEETPLGLRTYEKKNK